MYSIIQSDRDILDYTQAVKNKTVYKIHEVLRQYTGDYCIICRCRINDTPDINKKYKNPTVEHICCKDSYIHLVNQKSNMILMCYGCNNRRNNTVKEVINFNKYKNVHKMFELDEDGNLSVDIKFEDHTAETLKLCAQTLIAYKLGLQDSKTHRKTQKKYIDALLKNPECVEDLQVNFLNYDNSNIYPAYLLQCLEESNHDVFTSIKRKIEERWREANDC